MKCTLRKVAEGIVATLDERPKWKDWYYDELFNTCSIVIFKDETATVEDGFYKIIASNIENIAKKLILPNESILIVSSKEYEYTEIETQVIINL